MKNALLEQKKELEKESFVKMFVSNGNSPNPKDRLLVIVRQSDKFVNHLYDHGEYHHCDIIVSKNPITGVTTMSRRDESVDINCCDVMQYVYGAQAGGHAGIARSPRNVCSDTQRLIDYLKFGTK